MFLDCACLDVRVVLTCAGSVFCRLVLCRGSFGNVLMVRQILWVSGEKVTDTNAISVTVCPMCVQRCDSRLLTPTLVVYKVVPVKFLPLSTLLERVSHYTIYTSHIYRCASHSTSAGQNLHNCLEFYTKVLSLLPCFTQSNSIKNSVQIPTGQPVSLVTLHDQS